MLLESSAAALKVFLERTVISQSGSWNAEVLYTFQEIPAWVDIYCSGCGVKSAVRVRHLFFLLPHGEITGDEGDR